MKTSKWYLCVLLIVLPSLIRAQEIAPLVQNVNKAATVPDLLEMRSQLERFILAQPKEWLAGYYLAYVDVQLSFRVTAKEEKLKYLTDADGYLGQLPDLKANDLSEVYTLKAYRLYGLIASDPRTNGPLYYGEISSYYEKALGLNPANPRAIILYALFKNDMAKFMGNSYPDLQKDAEKANALLSKVDSTTTGPVWGMFWVNRAFRK